MSNARRFIQLPPADRKLLMRALLLLPVAKLVLRLCGFNRTFQLFTWVFSRRTSAQPAIAHDHAEGRCADKTMRLVRAAAVHGACQATCLPRSLVAWGLMRQQGLDPELRLGARKQAGLFEAHAWVEVGSVLFDPNVSDDERFVPFTPTSSQVPSPNL